MCFKCGISHQRPLGRAWHIEGDSVDRMMCGVQIDLDDGEVREDEPRRVCAACLDAQAASLPVGLPPESDHGVSRHVRAGAL